MIEVTLPTTAAALAQAFGASVIGDGEAEILSLSPLQTAGRGNLAFLANRKYGNYLYHIEGAVVFTSPALARPELPLTFILVADPQSAFAEVAKGFSIRGDWEGVSPQALVHPTTRLGPGVRVGPFAILSEGVVLGARTTVYPHVFLGAKVEVGEDCEIHPQVVIWDRVRLGNRVKVFAGTVLGSDGFGFLERGNSYSEMPQVGTVVVEDDVRIGAKCTVDRATLGETRVGRGTKMDDQVHVGHNCRVGKNVILCAQVGLGGSSVIEDDSILGGQVGIGHGVTVGKGARMGGQSGSSTNVPGNDTYFMTPALPIREVVKVLRYLRKLPQIWEKLRRLEEWRNGLGEKGISKE
jgi:UDP-3-O-[3-hydroxymyristoyl] glucosamine N-acyltransferase